MADLTTTLRTVLGPTTVLSQPGEAPTRLVTPVTTVIQGGDSGGAFMIVNRLSELNTPQAKSAARMNLELQSIDCGEFL